MNTRKIPAWWCEVLDAEEARVLRTYQRVRPPLSLARVALLVIDVVESFVGPEAPVDRAQMVARQACGEAAWQALPHLGRLLAAFRHAGNPVVYTVVAPPQRSVGAATPGDTDAPGGLRGDVVVDEVAPLPTELVLPKTKSSAFFGAPLIPALLRADVRTVVLTGGTTSGCVLATAIDAASNGFDVVVAADACFDRVRTLHDATLVTLDAKWARVVDTEPLLDLLSGTVGAP